MNEISLSNTAGITALLHDGTGLSGSMTKDIFLTEQSIVGTRYLGDAEDLIKELAVGSRVTLLHEADNRFDEKAVIVIDEQGRKLGYIPRHQNAVISALLDAGKMFYGVVREKPERMRDKDSSAPYKFMIDLYMREFAGPEDPAAIPRQGYQSSYAVVALVSEGKTITGICALKIINGEERGIYYRELDESAGREEQRQMFDAFEEMVGYLPIISYGISGMKLQLLEEAYGVLLGRSFSNHVIDVRKMAGIHIKERQMYSLDACAAWLGITCEAESELEKECRLTWKLYCRMDRSELQHQKTETIRLISIDDLLEENKISTHVFHCLQKENIILLGDLVSRSRKDIRNIKTLKERETELLDHLVRSYGFDFADEDFEPPVIRFNMLSDIEDLREQSLQSVLDGLDEEERNGVLLLSEEERRLIVTDILDQKIALCKKYHKEDYIPSVLFLGVFAGYRGDYSVVGFSQMDGRNGIDQNVQNGFVTLTQFYDEYHKGMLREDAGKSMLKTCVALGEGIYRDDIMEGDFDQQTRRDIAQYLFDEAVSYALEAPAEPETIDLLMKIGTAFYEGELQLPTGETVGFNQSYVSAYKAFYYANEIGNDKAEIMIRRIKEERK